MADDRINALLMAQEAAARLTHDVTQSEEVAGVRERGTVALSLLSIAQDMRQIRETLQGAMTPSDEVPLRVLWVKGRISNG